MSLIGKAALFLTTIIWGTSFVVMKNTLDGLPPLYLLAFRFTLATIILFIAGAKSIRQLDRKTIISGAVLGAMFYIAYVFQTIGLKYTTPGKNAFLTAIYCVIVPFMYWGLTKKRPDAFNFLAAVLCIVGIGFITLDGDLSIGKGDFLTIICGFAFAMHIVGLGRADSGKSMVLFSAVQFAACAVLGWITAPMFEAFPKTIPTNCIWSLLYLAAFPSALCMFLQTFGQRHSSSSAAAVILSLEAFFGALCSVIMGTEPLSAELIIGFVLIMAAVITSETKLSFLPGRKKQ